MNDSNLSKSLEYIKEYFDANVFNFKQPSIKNNILEMSMYHKESVKWDVVYMTSIFLDEVGNAHNNFVIKDWKESLHRFMYRNQLFQKVHQTQQNLNNRTKESVSDDWYLIRYMIDAMNKIFLPLNIVEKYSTNGIHIKNINIIRLLSFYGLKTCSYFLELYCSCILKKIGFSPNEIDNMKSIYFTTNNIHETKQQILNYYFKDKLMLNIEDYTFNKHFSAFYTCFITHTIINSSKTFESYNDNLATWLKPRNYRKDLEWLISACFPNSDDVDLKLSETYDDNVDKCIEKVLEGKVREQYIVDNTIYGRSVVEKMKALENAHYLCEFDDSHKTFLRKNKTPYTEAHHLLPIHDSRSLDDASNIVSLCPICHKQIHYGIENEKIIRVLYDKRKDLLKRIGIDISVEDLIAIYNK